MGDVCESERRAIVTSDLISAERELIYDAHAYASHIGYDGHTTHNNGNGRAERLINLIE
jgi:hypothetical protein